MRARSRLLSVFGLFAVLTWLAGPAVAGKEGSRHHQRRWFREGIGARTGLAGATAADTLLRARAATSPHTSEPLRAKVDRVGRVRYSSLEAQHTKDGATEVTELETSGNGMRQRNFTFQGGQLVRVEVTRDGAPLKTYEGKRLAGYLRQVAGGQRPRPTVVRTHLGERVWHIGLGGSTRDIMAIIRDLRGAGIYVSEVPGGIDILTSPTETRTLRAIVAKHGARVHDGPLRYAH